MTYATFEELLLRDSTYHDYSPESVNSGTIYFAERDVEARLAQGYTVPFTAAHPTVKDLTLMESLWRLERDLSRKTQMREELDARYGRLLSGTEILMTGSGGLAPSGAALEPWSPLTDYKPTFDTRAPEDQRIDPDRQDAEEAEDNA